VLPGVPGWDALPAVREGREWAVDANSYFSRPAPRVVDGAEILGSILHPGALRAEQAAAVRLAQASGWPEAQAEGRS
jgi:iron complex transport system substrate-binding protein